jgi:hypothetical protein
MPYGEYVDVVSIRARIDVVAAAAEWDRERPDRWSTGRGELPQVPDPVADRQYCPRCVSGIPAEELIEALNIAGDLPRPRDPGNSGVRLGQDRLLAIGQSRERQAIAARP